jgi:hypothetical protein
MIRSCFGADGLDQTASGNPTLLDDLAMDQAVFDDLQRRLAESGATAAIAQLCTVLRERKDYPNLFYALLLKKRHELGVSPIPTGPSQELPQAVHAPYEDAIREAARVVGGLFLQDGNITHAWAYFRMIGENEPVARALEQAKPGEDEDVGQLVDIAYHQGVHPRKGFDLILERFGICNAITTVTGQGPNLPADVQEYCLKRLVRALYAELVERLKADIVRREEKEPAATTVRELMAGRDWLFADEFYHIDVSHLGAVVQMSMYLSPGEELSMARELCAYGQHLSSRFQYQTDPPFENLYHDYGVYLAILAGDDVDNGLEHFRAKVENADEDSGTRPAEVLVNLLVRLNRPAEALSVARRHLAAPDGRQLACPGIPELCQRARDYATLAEVAREQSDPVHFLAGLLLSQAQINSH